MRYRSAGVERRTFMHMHRVFYSPLVQAPVQELFDRNHRVLGPRQGPPDWQGAWLGLDSAPTKSLFNTSVLPYAVLHALRPCVLMGGVAWLANTLV